MCENGNCGNNGNFVCSGCKKPHDLEDANECGGCSADMCTSCNTDLKGYCSDLCYSEMAEDA